MLPNELPLKRALDNTIYGILCAPCYDTSFSAHAEINLWDIIDTYAQKEMPNVWYEAIRESTRHIQEKYDIDDDHINQIKEKLLKNNSYFPRIDTVTLYDACDDLYVGCIKSQYRMF